MPPEEPKGNDGPEPSKGAGDQPQGVTLEQVNEIVSKAISSRNKQFEIKIDKAFGDIATKLDEKFASFKPAEPDPSSQKPPTESPEFKAVQRQLTDLQKQLEKERQDKQAADARARAQSLRQRLQDGLSAGGISGKQLQYALGVLVDSEKRVRFDEDGERVLFKGDDGEELPLNDGLAAWLKGDDAKMFLPPRGTTGSGHRPTGTIPTGNHRAPPANGQLGQQLANALFGPGVSASSVEE